jgi:lipoprotein-anchoring transpeptidase ErfK/SrfK
LKKALVLTAAIALLATPAWAGRSILVDKSENVLLLKDDGQVVKRYVVSTGKDNSTPAGKYKIINKLEDPTWYKPGGGVYKAGDKKNEIGTRWMGLSKKGYGIHGTIEPQRLGEQVSHGCVRMKNEEIEELFKLVPTGTPVTIKD